MKRAQPVFWPPRSWRPQQRPFKMAQLFVRSPYRGALSYYMLAAAPTPTLLSFWPTRRQQGPKHVLRPAVASIAVGRRCQHRGAEPLGQLLRLGNRRKQRAVLDQQVLR